jgi:aryl-alcohol dehydrogenase-like predicted oxidoreductase
MRNDQLAPPELNMLNIELRPLGSTGILVTPVALGCWPISGMTSLDVNEADSLATIQAALDAGINFLDTAYAYGADGESERLIARAIAGRRDRVVIATKGGIAWDAEGRRVIDARPETLRRQCEESLRRLGTGRRHCTCARSNARSQNRHAPVGREREPSAFPISPRSARRIPCRLSARRLSAAVHMLHRDIESDSLVNRARHRGCSYWPLMKGLLAGKLARDHVFRPGDGRAKYPAFVGDEWQRNQDFLDELRAIAAASGRTVAQVAVNWTIQQPGITAALCGAKRPEQIRETAGALGWQLTPHQLACIDAALARRGKPITRGAV